MSNFNKFLKNKEVLRLEIVPKKATFKFYFVLILILLMFFLMFPAWRAGEMGVFLWFVALITLIFSLTRQLLSVNDRYLLTNKRIIHLRALNKKNFAVVGAIRLSELEEIGFHGRASIYLLASGRKIYLQNINRRDKVFSKLETYLNK
mgnify:FL=1|jgi:hypothetical protein